MGLALANDYCVPINGQDDKAQQIQKITIDIKSPTT
jgi:hypothetical protein